jgi:hypothetical protein
VLILVYHPSAEERTVAAHEDAADFFEASDELDGSCVKDAVVLDA